MVLKNTLPNKLCNFTLLLYLRSFFKKLLKNARKCKKKKKIQLMLIVAMAALGHEEKFFFI